MVAPEAVPGTALLRLLQLSSPALPIGAFNFSQGLEYAVEAGWVRNEAGALDWISGVLADTQARLDVPLLLRLHAAWTADDAAQAHALNLRLLAARDTAELRAEDRHMGRSLAKLLVELGCTRAAPYASGDDTSYAAMFALAAVHWRIGAREAATAYLWAWAENQVLAAIKLVPLGQTAGQRLLHALIPRMPLLVEAAAALPERDIGSATPRLGIASALHETQYTRLFRS